MYKQIKYFCIVFSVIFLTACSGNSGQGNVQPTSGAPIAPVDVAQPANTEAVFDSAPDLVGLTNWINSESIASLEDLRGKVVLIDFWTYDCINCIRTLPHVQALYEKYDDQGFVVLGLHAPEFSYERKIENVRREVVKHGLTYPIAQDNDFATWNNYKNRYWPAHYLIDKEGRLRHKHFGEGAYDEMDAWVAKLLNE